MDQLLTYTLKWGTKILSKQGKTKKSCTHYIMGVNDVSDQGQKHGGKRCCWIMKFTYLYNVYTVA